MAPRDPAEGTTDLFFFPGEVLVFRQPWSLEHRGQCLENAALLHHQHHGVAHVDLGAPAADLLLLQRCLVRKVGHPGVEIDYGYVKKQVTNLEY